MRSQLPRTYYAFLARFRHPNPIQQRAAEPLLRGDSVLLVSATASGKTEAFSAPLVERYFDQLKSHQKHLVLVCPTRALVNDAHRRLQAPLKACGFKIGRRTSDASENPEAQKAALWITTPEGLDSLLCRFPRWMAGSAALILDEAHLLHGSPRGTQVLCLMERLDWVCRATGNPSPQRVAATATAPEAEALATLFLGESSVVIREEMSRPIRLHYHDWIDYDCLRDTLADLEQARKVLLFANSRREAEEAALSLKGRPPYGNHVYVHHSSLSRPLRLSAEHAFLQQPCALMCATTTMEVGVDIGDIDWVVLLHPPESRTNFVQRVGRAGRRSSRSGSLAQANKMSDKSLAQALAVFRQKGELLRYQYFLARSQNPGAFSVGPIPQHQSVVVQQGLSLLFQNPRKQIQASALHSRLAPHIRDGWSEAEVDELLQSLAREGWLESQAGSFGAGPKALRAHTLGHLHANIGGLSGREVEIRDSMSGQVLGSLKVDGRGKIPAQIQLGGRSHQLRRDPHQRGLVVARPAGQALDHSLGVTGPAAPFELPGCQDFANWLGLGPRCLLSGPQGNLLGHFLGTTWGKILKRHLEQCYPGSILYADPFVVAWRGSYTQEVWNRDALWGCLQKFAPLCRREMQLGRWFRYLPKARQRQELRQLLYWNWIEEVWLATPPQRVEGEQAGPLKDLLQRDSELSIAGFFPIQAEDL